MTNRKATISFNPSIRFTPRKGEAFTLSIADAPESILGELLITGLRIKATNAYNSGGKDVPEADRRRNVERLFAAWNRGEAGVGNSGPRDSYIGEMRELYVAERVAESNGTRTAKDVDELIKRTVSQVFGDKEKATFPRFLDAVATIKTRDNPGEMEKVRAAIEAELVAKVDALRKERAKATEAVDVSADDLGF